MCSGRKHRFSQKVLCIMNDLLPELLECLPLQRPPSGGATAVHLARNSVCVKTSAVTGHKRCNKPCIYPLLILLQHDFMRQKRSDFVPLSHVGTFT